MGGFTQVAVVQSDLARLEKVKAVAYVLGGGNELEQLKGAVRQLGSCDGVVRPDGKRGVEVEMRG